MRYVLGFDGGGTKTECVVLDGDGRESGRGRGGPSNPVRVGFADAVAAVREAARSAICGAGIAMEDVGALCAGLAGTAYPDSARKMECLLGGEFPRKLVRVCTDLDLTLECAAPGAAIVLIAGTGSAAIGRDAHGRTGRVGGHGYLLGDEGSAYHVGQQAVKGALRHIERTGADTKLGERILADTGENSWAELQARINAAPDDVLPGLFPLVLEAAQSGDAEACSLLEESAAALTGLVKDLAQRLQLNSQKFLLARTGGMLGRSRYFDERLDEHLREAVPPAQFGELQMGPAEAAARMALKLLLAA